MFLTVKEHLKYFWKDTAAAAAAAAAADKPSTVNPSPPPPRGSIVVISHAVTQAWVGWVIKRMDCAVDAY